MSHPPAFVSGLRPRRVLLLLGQSPFDPTSGAAQSTRLIAETLAQQGFAVRALATTACEGDFPGGHASILADLRVALQPNEDDRGLHFESQAVSYTLLPVEPRWKHAWEGRVGLEYQAEYTRLLTEWQPEFVLTYGGDASDTRRRRQARRAGAKVVFALHNLYYRTHPPHEVDAFLAPTQFLADAYGDLLEAPITVLPPPLDSWRVLAASPEPIAVCFVNPEPAKGALLVAHLADRLGRERPDIPLLVVGGRTPAEGLALAGKDLGFDLTRYANLLQVPPIGCVSEIWSAARVVLMPSVVKEAAGRCALEAMLNGVIPLVSDQGGLAEIVGDAGIRLPPPPELTGRAQAVPAKIVDAWWDAITACFDQNERSRKRAEACRHHAAKNTVEAVGPAYTKWFNGLRSMPQPPVGARG